MTTSQKFKTKPKRRKRLVTVGIAILAVVHLTDLHGASFGKNNAVLLARINKESPNIIVVTGDMFVRGGSQTGIDAAVRLMTDLGERYAVFFVDGGHDGYIGQLINGGEINAAYLDYKTAEVTISDTPLAIHGIADSYFASLSHLNLADVLDVDDSIYNILLAHEARLSDYSKLGVNLALCGHTHGGMVRLPFAGAVFYRSTLNAGYTLWFPEARGILHLKGLIERDDTKLHISSGLGLYPAPVRFFNRPEVVVVRLLPKN